MSTVSTVATIGTTTTTASSGRPHSLPCPICGSSIDILTAATNISCQNCNRRFLIRFPRTANPNPDLDSTISVYGPLAPNPNRETPLHHSDYIDFNDERLFDSILDRIASRHNGQNRSTGQNPTSKSVIDSLPTTKITACLLDSGLSLCSICKDEFAVNEHVKVLPCKHLYHPDCIVPWLNRSNTCPLCRHKLPAESTPLMRYLVKIGILRLEGWGQDPESAFRDAVLRNGLFDPSTGRTTRRRSSISTTTTNGMGQFQTLRRVIRVRRRSSSSSSRSVRGQVGMVGPSSSEDTVNSPLTPSPVFEREVATSRLDNWGVDAMLDDDGDTMMLDA